MQGAGSGTATGQDVRRRGRTCRDQIEEIPMRLRLSCVLGLALAASSAHAGDVSVQLDSGTGFSVKNAGGAVERLRVDEATGNVSRNGALFVHTTGVDSLYVGPGAGNPTTTGYWNAAFGSGALQANTTGLFNTAVGFNALHLNTSGGTNAAFGAEALRNNTVGSGNTAVGPTALRDNTTGGLNVAVGGGALRSNTTGIHNAALGYHSLFSNVTGSGNAAFGAYALRSSFGAAHNSAFGASALRNNSTGARNSALGQFALYSNTTGADNTAIGRYALKFNNAGSRNIAIGSGAGESLTTGSDNIHIGSNSLAVESGQIRIGSDGSHTQAHIAGIFGNTSASGLPVLVNNLGTLGTTTSSARFKQDVRDMGDASDILMRLRPVTFRYLEDAVGADGAKTKQYGLIAEEVAEVAPELVVSDAEGRPYSVKYHELPSLLLAEAQKQRSAAASQERRLAEQAARIAAQQQEIASLTHRLARLEAARGAADVAAAR
jgi:hypothetical protein